MFDSSAFIKLNQSYSPNLMQSIFNLSSQINLPFFLSLLLPFQLSFLSIITTYTHDYIRTSNFVLYLSNLFFSFIYYILCVCPTFFIFFFSYSDALFQQQPISVPVYLFLLKMVISNTGLWSFFIHTFCFFFLATVFPKYSPFFMFFCL